MSTLWLVASLLSARSTFLTGPALSAAVAVASVAGCTGPGTTVRRPPSQLYVEPAYFDDERSAAEPESAAPERRQASPPFPRTPSGLSRSGRDRCESVRPLAVEVSERHGLDLALVMAVARVESDYVPAVKNRRTGATGLMQVMPSTGKHFSCGDLEAPADNLECGARVLGRYLKYFKGDYLYAVAAYHAGPKWAARAQSENLLPSNFTYVEKVMQLRTRFLRVGCE